MAKEFDDVQLDVEFEPAANHNDNLVSKENISLSFGKIAKWKTDFHSSVWSGYGLFINGHTISIVEGGTSSSVDIPDDFGDEKVKQNYSTDNGSYPILLSDIKDITSTSNRGNSGSILNNSIYVNPSTGTLSATSFSGDGSNITNVTASKLSSNAGSLTQPVYFTKGIPVATSYTLEKSVPADAVFTDHITSATTTGSGNAVTAVTADVNGALTVTKGSSFVLRSGDTMTGSLTMGTANQAAVPTVGITIQDIRNATIEAGSGPGKAMNMFFTNKGTPDTNWWSIIHMAGWTTNYNKWEVAGPSHDSDQRTTPLYVRSSNKNTAWGSWRKIYDTSNPPTASEVGAAAADHTHNYVPNTQAGVNAALNLLSTGSSAPSDDDYFISQYANGGTTTTTYHRRPVSKLWDLFKTKISATNSSSGSVVIGVTQTDGAFTVTLGEPNVTVTNPTAQTSYGVLFAADPNTTERNALRKNNNFRFREVLGTTSTEGAADIILGNSVSKGTANNLTGTIILYGDGAYNARIMPITGMTAHRTITIPNKNGTFALTSDIVTYSFATGDEAGSIKVTPSGGTASNIRVRGLGHVDGDSTGMGIILQASGLTMVGAGESATALQSALSLGGATELLYLSSDQHIHFYTNCQTIADRRHILELKNNGNAAFDGNITVSGTVYNLLELKRTDSANGAGIKFYNNNGLLGSICMTGTADGGLKRYKSDDSTSYTFLDTGNFSISRSLTSGTKIATITVNGTATDLYCQTNTNTDTMVTQTATSTDANYEVLFSGTADSTTRTEGARKSTGLKFNPNYKRLTFDAWEIPDITGATADLNSYTDASGNYKYRRIRCMTTGGGSNISNKPADSPFVLEVILIRWASNTDYITKQIYHCHNKKTYQRFCTNGTWDAWTEIKTTDTNTTYTFATGSTQGAFTVTPSGGTAQTVKIHDLGNIYTTATNHNASDDLDWNLYVNNGWHMAANAANSPDSSVTWWIGIVSRHNEKYITQDVWSFTDSANNIARHYVRRKVNNVWGQWNEVKYTDTTYGAEKGISLTSGKFGHSNTAITAATTAVFKKITYDAYGHITGTAAVAAADLPSHTHLYAKSETAGGPAYSVAGTAGTDDTDRRVWFSVSSDSERRAYDDDFTYNPSKNNLKLGGIKSGRTTSTYLAGNQGSAIIESLSTAGSYVMLAKMNSTNGVFTHGTYQTRYELHYTSNTTINAGTNSVDKNVTLLDESGNAVWPGHIRSNTRLIAYSATPSAALQSGHLIIGSTSSAYNASGDGGNGGDVAMEFWRGKSASWQILNSGGNLYFRTNYKDSAAQSSYSVTSFSIAHSSGDLTFTGIANFNNHINFATVTSTTYPALSKKIVFNGSTDGADIYYRVDASDAGRLVLNLRDDSNTKICFALNGTDFATIDTSGVYSGTATTATNAVNAKVTVTNPDAQTTYGLVFAADPSTTGNYALRKNNNIRTNQLKGTTSALGLSELVLGNSTAKDADANSYGRLGIYSKQSYYYHLEPPDTTTAHRTHKFIDADGSIALLKNINNFWGLIDGTGSDQGWIRTTKYGIIPYASDSDATYGHTVQLGTSSWHFAHAYVDNYSAKSVTKSTIDSITGSSFIAGSNLIGDGNYDWIGIQAYASNDKFQMLANSNRIIFRQNDTGGTDAANWNSWISCMAPSDVTGSGGITATVVTSDIGTVKVGRTVTISHSNSITAVTTAVFKKFTYDAQGHITGSAAVAAADLPSHTHSYLPLTGGTVTGAITYKTTLDASLANNGMSSGTGYPTTFNILDKNDKIMVRTEGTINSNGNIGWNTYVRNYNTSGTQVAQKGLSFTMNKDGNLTWSVSDAPAFKTAIGNPERTVRQSVTTTTNYRPLLSGANNAATRTGLTTTVDGESYISDNFFVQPSSGCLYATNLVAHTEGTGTVYFSLWRNGGRSFHIENANGAMYIKTNYAFNSSTNAWDKTSDGSYSTTFFRNELRSGKSVPYNVFDGIIEANQTIVARNANGIRLQYGSYSTIMRNDGSDTYFLLTNAGNQDTNTWNDFRPFAIHNSTGQVQMNNNLFLNGCQLLMSRNSRTGQPINIPANTTDITTYGDSNGSLMVMGFAGCTVMSAGEVGDGIINEIKTSTNHSFLLQADAQQPYTGGSELAIVASDGPIIFMVNGGTYANRKSVVLDNSMNLYPISKDTGSIGHTNYHWGTGYINDLNVKKISSAGGNSLWVTGMDNAVVRMTTADNKYRPILATHTETGGFWALGNHTGDSLLFTFVTAANYSSKTNTSTAQIGIATDNRVYIGGVNNRQSALYENGLRLRTTSAEGWTMGMKVVKNSDSSDLGTMGFYGGANTLEYAYIGPAYNNYRFRVDLNSTSGIVRVRGSQPGLRFIQTTEGKTYDNAWTGINVFAADTNGANIVMQSGGNMIIGSGESGNYFYNLETKNAFDYWSATGESTYILSDGHILLESNCNTIANRKRFLFTNTGNFYVENTQSIGFLDQSGSNYHGLIKCNTLDAQRTINFPNTNGTIEIRKEGFMYDETTDYASYSWHKVASATLSNQFQDKSIVFLVSKTWGQVPTNEGLLVAHIRTDSGRTCTGTVQFKWLVAGTDIVPANFVLIYKNTASTKCDVEIWYKQTAQYDGWFFKAITMFSRTAVDLNGWTLYNTLGHGSASYTSGYTVVESSILNPSLVQDVNVTQTTNLNIVRPLLIAASSANPSNTYQSSSSSSAESRSTSTSYNGAINMTGGAYIKTRQWTSGGSQGKTYTTLCAGSFEATDPNGQFVGLASKAYADEDGKRIRDTYGLKTDKIYQSSTTTLSEMSNPVTINPGTLSTYDFLTIVIKSDASGATYHMVQIPALDGFHQVPLTGNAANTLTNPIIAGGCIKVTAGTNTITLQIYSTNQYNISTSVTKVSTAKVFKIYRVYGTRV